MVALNKTYRKTLTPDRSAKDSGLRFYSPEISRWLNRDPIGEEGGTGLYRFVSGDPANNSDAVGLISFRDLLHMVGGVAFSPAGNLIFGGYPNYAVAPIGWLQRLYATAHTETVVIFDVTCPPCCKKYMLNHTKRVEYRDVSWDVWRGRAGASGLERNVFGGINLRLRLYRDHTTVKTYGCCCRLWGYNNTTRWIEHSFDRETVTAPQPGSLLGVIHARASATYVRRGFHRERRCRGGRCRPDSMQSYSHTALFASWQPAEDEAAEQPSW
jgi:RHS repeat-associated protein